MQTLSKWIVSFVFAVVLIVPLSASAVGVPFGGIVTGMTPCHIGPVAALWLNVLGVSFVITGGTVPFLHYVPIIGQFILGVADVPIVCSVGTVPLPPGLRVQIYGTSAAPL